MSISRVLQVKRTEVGAGVVLINVTAESATSLNLDLKATEGTAPYGGQVAGDRIASLRSSNYKGSDEEWRVILGWLLFGRSPAATYQTLVKQVELVATIAPDTEITLTIRQNIIGITHRLGNIILPYDDNVEIELFDWNVIATDDRGEAERKAQDLQQRFDEQQKILNKLNTQLQELIEAKKRHEDELLEKFRHLLNSKKAKIRDQMRLLSTAKIDQTTAKKVRATRGGSETPAPAGKTRRTAGKRKAQVEDDEDEDVYQTQEPKMANEDTDTDPDITHTPNQDMSETETDDGNSSAEKPQNSNPKAASQAKSKSPPAPAEKPATRASKPRITPDDESSDSGFEAAPVSQSQTSRVRASQSSQSQHKQKSPQELPPRRELPFGKGRQSGAGPLTTPAPATKKKPPPVIDDDETDDEL